MNLKVALGTSYIICVRCPNTKTLMFLKSQKTASKEVSKSENGKYIMLLSEDYIYISMWCSFLIVNNVVFSNIYLSFMKYENLPLNF